MAAAGCPSSAYVRTAVAPRSRARSIARSRSARPRPRRRHAGWTATAMSACVSCVPRHTRLCAISRSGRPGSSTTHRSRRGSWPGHAIVSRTASSLASSSSPSTAATAASRAASRGVSSSGLTGRLVTPTSRGSSFTSPLLRATPSRTPPPFMGRPPSRGKQHTPFEQIERTASIHAAPDEFEARDLPLDLSVAVLERQPRLYRSIVIP